MALEEGRRALRGLDVEAEVVEAAYERQSLLLVHVRNRGEHGAGVRDAHPAGLEGLVERAVYRAVYAYGLAGGLHLGREVGVEPGELGEAESRGLYEELVAVGRAELRYPLLGEADAQHGERADVGEGAARGLGDEGHRAA